MLKCKGKSIKRGRDSSFATDTPAHLNLSLLPRRAGWAALVAVLAATIALTGEQTASAAPGTVGVTASARGPLSQSVTLPTGEQVTVSGAPGKSVYSIAAPKGRRNAYASFSAGTADYLIPSEAQPYLGSVLSPELFDVTRLLHAGGAWVPVRLAFAAGVLPSAPPGVTVTSTSGSTAQGYLTASSGAAFAAGLRVAIGADVAAGRQAGRGPLFGGLASMSLSTAATDPGVHPHYVMHPLQVNSADITGAPSDVFAVLMNNDSFSKENASLPIYHGVGRIQVPAGDYSIAAYMFDYDADGNPTASRIVAINDFTVPDTAGATTTIRLDESSANSLVSAVTPQPTTQEFTRETWSRLDPTGAGRSLGIVNYDDVPMYVSPQPAAARVGSMHFQVQFFHAGPTTGPQYRYDTAFMNSTILADQTYKLRPSQLATVHQNMYADPAASGTFGVSFGAGAANPYTNPSVRIDALHFYHGPFTEYVGTANHAEWYQGVLNASAVMFGDPHVYRAGHTYRNDWFHGPLAPNVGQYTEQPFGNYWCFACASGTAATVNFNILGDSTPDHTSDFANDQTLNDVIYVNGTKVFDKSGASGADLTGLPAGTSTFREVYDMKFSDLSYVSQSTATHTDLTFRYTLGLDPSNTLPSGYICSDDGGVTVTAPCQVLPVMSLNYQLAADLHNTSAAPEQTMRLTVGHLSYGGHGSHAPITSARVSVSFDGDKTWVPALVAGFAGHYTVCWQNPVSAAGTSPELKVTATDALGGSITQTITAAYTIAAQLK